MVAHSNKFLHLLFSFGVFGLFFVSIVDSSFVPLPIPGVTDIMLVLFAAQKTNWLLLVVLATTGSAVGGYLSYLVGQSGGMGFLEKHVPARIFRPVCEWMQDHAILSVALPALLPPPMPLSPFVLAAGALKMSRSKFMTTFTISRAVRHSIAVFLGIHYGKHVLRVLERLFPEVGHDHPHRGLDCDPGKLRHRLLEALQTSRSVGVGGLKSEPEAM